MANRFKRDGGGAPGTGARSAATTTDPPPEDARADERRGRDRDRRREGRPAAVDRGRLADMRRRQHEEFGGIAWGSAFFGWLTATGLGAILAGILAAIGAALALTDGNQVNAGAETIGVAGGIALLVVLAVSYFCGGYVAGRMARFDGVRQGVGVFVWALIAAAVLAVAGAIGGSEYNVLERLDLPRLPVDEGTLTTGGLIALAAGLLTMLVAAILGGKIGERFHRKVDRTALDAPTS